MKRVCVFCGSAAGSDSAYGRCAEELGRLLARRGLGIVYGGGGIGLMGALADAALAAGGEVVGVIPAALASAEVAHHGLTELRVVASMHERKASMARSCDGFLALPGGWGTLDELCEAVTGAQLGVHTKPVGLLDVAGFFDPLLAFFDAAVEAGFLRREHRAMLLVDEDPDRLLDAMDRHEPSEASLRLSARWARPGRPP